MWGWFHVFASSPVQLTNSEMHISRNLLFLLCSRRVLVIFLWLLGIGFLGVAMMVLDLLCRPGWPQTQMTADFCLTSAGIQGVHHHWLSSALTYMCFCFQITVECTFLDYIMGGCQLNFTVSKTEFSSKSVRYCLATPYCSVLLLASCLLPLQRKGQSLYYFSWEVIIEGILNHQCKKNQSALLQIFRVHTHSSIVFYIGRLWVKMGIRN